MDTIAQRSSGSSPRPAKPSSPGGSPLLQLYKPGQGQYVRWGSAVGAGILGVAFANFVYEQFGALSQLTFGVGESGKLITSTVAAAVTLVVMGILIFWLFGRHHGMCDFLIATEGEMKKVNWSTRREVLGATKVVIFMVLAMSLLLFIADLMFMLFFGAIGVLKVDLLGNIFGGQ